MPATPSPPNDLASDPLLRDVPTIAGFKVLEPAVLYAKVGAGGMGAVYRGRHFKLDLDVAVKCLKPSLADDAPEFVARFEREARLAASLAHQNVVRVMDVHHKHGVHYLVMEFVRGETARERVLRKGRLGEQEALAIVLGAASGLAEAHQRGIVHRDIKPDNVLVSTEGRVKLADLGLAKAQAAGEQSMSLASGVMGTPQYMAPEQWDTPAVGPSADVWALGATLYYLLVGEHAIEATSLAAVARRVQDRDFPSLRDALPGLREEVYALFERCVARDPAARFDSARELVKALAPLVELGEDALADAESASNTARVGVVSPPPRQTLMRIRAAVESGTSIDPEAPTIPSPGDTMRMAPPRAGASTAAPRARGGRWLVALLLVFATAVGGGGWLLGWFDGSVDIDDGLLAARSHYQRGMQLLPLPDGLDGAIDAFEAALRASDAFDAAKAPLALAYDKKAERLQDEDLDAAFEASRRGHDWLPGDERITPRYEALLARMRQRLVAGLALEAPAGNDVQNSSYLVCAEEPIELRGRITSKGFRRLLLRVPLELSTDGTPLGAQRKVDVVAGEFTTKVALPPGDSKVTFVLEDERLVDAGVTRTARVPGRVGDVDGPALLAGTVPRYTIFNAAGCRMLPVQVAPFRMGSNAKMLGRDPDEVPHRVVLTDGFWLADTEVTRAQWRRVMDTTPWPDTIQGFTDDLPATHVTPNQAIAFCERLTELERAAKRLPPNYHYALPTEAQWEFACRNTADNVGFFAVGVDYGNLKQHAVYQDARESARPSLVASREPDSLGLYDMHGNVSEWCLDLAMSDLRSGDIATQNFTEGAVEPVSLVGALRVHRGGSYESPTQDLRASDRAAAPINTSSPTIGFRPALVRRR